MRMTRDSYAREVWKAIEAVHRGEAEIPCPHENCQQRLRILSISVRTGRQVVCPEHGLIFRE